MNVNRAIICGRLTKDPELKSTTSGTSVCEISIATNRVWKDNNGQKKEDTEFHNVVLWGKVAEIVKQFSVKGSELFVEGRLQTRTWDDKQGVKHYKTEIVAENIQLGAKPSGAGKPANRAQQEGPSAQSPAERGEDVPVINLEEEEKGQDSLDDFNL